MLRRNPPADRHASMRRRTRLLLVPAAALVLAGCAGTGAPDAVGGTIRLGDQSFESLSISNAVASFVLQHGYGRDVELVTSSTPVMQQALVQGDLDVQMEIYPHIVTAWWEQVQAEGTVVAFNAIMETSRRGFYVPRYVIEGDAARGIEAVAPDLRTFEDLIDLAHLFPDPEDPTRGQLISCIIGWACADSVAVKAAAYGVDGAFNLLQPGAAAAMDAAIVSAYRNGVPAVFYYWEPTWLVAELDLYQLEMDPWTPACEEVNAAAMVGGEVTDAARCAFPEPPVFIAANAAWAAQNPEISALFERMFIGIDRFGELSSWMNENGTEPPDAALHYLRTYPEEWAEWMPEDVAERVRQALAAAS